MKKLNDSFMIERSVKKRTHRTLTTPGIKKRRLPKTKMMNTKNYQNLILLKIVPFFYFFFESCVLRDSSTRCVFRKIEILTLAEDSF